MRIKHTALFSTSLVKPFIKRNSHWCFDKALQNRLKTKRWRINVKIPAGAGVCWQQNSPLSSCWSGCDPTVMDRGISSRLLFIFAGAGNITTCWICFTLCLEQANCKLNFRYKWEGTCWKLNAYWRCKYGVIL